MSKRFVVGWSFLDCDVNHLRTLTPDAADMGLDPPTMAAI
jgi:hypothetical protein